MLDSLSLGEFGVWAWWIIAAVLGILELIVPGIFFVWLAAAAAFCDAEGVCARVDLLLALNRLSSYFYVLQLEAIRRREG